MRITAEVTEATYTLELNSDEMALLDVVLGATSDGVLEGFIKRADDIEDLTRSSAKRLQAGGWTLTRMWDEINKTVRA